MDLTSVQSISSSIMEMLVLPRCSEPEPRRMCDYNKAA